MRSGLTRAVSVQWVGMARVEGAAGRCLWLLGACRNAIVVVCTGALGYWFVAQHGDLVPFRLMGEITAPIPVWQTFIYLFYLFKGRKTDGCKTDLGT